MSLENTITKKLLKKEYHHNKAIQILDEEFSEFALKKPNRQRFFNLYNDLFYELPRTLHAYFVKHSTSRVGPYVYPEEIEIENLEKQITTLKKEINSIELHHPFFKNGQILIDEQHYDRGIGRIDSPKFYMHSGKKRRIPWDYSLYLPIKRRLGYITSEEEISDNKYTIKVSQSTLSGIPDGPPLLDVQGLFAPIYDVNTYNGQGV